MGLGYVRPVSTGVRGLDDHLDGGFQRGEFTLLGAASGHGKTTLAMQFARMAAAQFPEEKVIFCSPEMRLDAIAEMEWCAQAGLSRQSLAKHPHELERNNHVEEAVPENVIVVEMPRGSSIAELCDTVRDVQSMAHVSLVILDYAQFVLGRIEGDKTPRYALAQQIVEACEEISRSKSAGDEGLPRYPAVLLTSQINVTKEKGKVVDMGIRESALFEHGAGALVYFVREFDPETNEESGAYFRITKARFGKLGKVSVKNRAGFYAVEEDLEVKF